MLVFVHAAIAPCQQTTTAQQQVYGGDSKIFSEISAPVEDSPRRALGDLPLLQMNQSTLVFKGWHTKRLTPVKHP